MVGPLSAGQASEDEVRERRHSRNMYWIEQGFGSLEPAVASAGAATFFTLITEVIGALLAKYYFWPRYGTQQWRQ